MAQQEQRAELPLLPTHQHSFVAHSSCSAEQTWGFRHELLSPSHTKPSQQGDVMQNSNSALHSFGSSHSKFSKLHTSPGLKRKECGFEGRSRLHQERANRMHSPALRRSAATIFLGAWDGADSRQCAGNFQIYQIIARSLNALLQFIVPHSNLR